MDEKLKSGGSSGLPDSRKRIRLTRRIHLGFLVLLVVLVPHFMGYVVEFVLRYSQVKIDDAAILYIVCEHFMQVFALLGMAAFFIALHIVLQKRRKGAKWFDINRICAIVALLVFIVSVKNPMAHLQYHRSVRPVPYGKIIEWHSTRTVYKVQYKFSDFADEHPSKYYPPLKRMKGSNPHTISDSFEELLPAEGLPLVVQWGNRQFYYPGYCLRNEADMERFVHAYQQALNAENSECFTLEQSGLYRLGEYLQPSKFTGLFLPEEAWSGVPVLIEQIDLEQASKGCVFFADGDVEVLAYPGPWPMTVATMKQLKALSDESLQKIKGD